LFASISKTKRLISGYKVKKGQQEYIPGRCPELSSHWPFLLLLAKLKEHLYRPPIKSYSIQLSEVNEVKEFKILF
jgi:hypothetical protein